MRMNRTFGPERLCPRAGSALIVSLVFIILITIVIVGFVTTAGLERKTVQSHYARVQADLFNTMAAGVVASRITLAASQTNAWMVSQPGRLAMTTFATSPQTTFVDLTSGTAASVIADVSTELNIASLTQGTGVIVSSSTTSLPVSWIYVRKDGKQDPAAATAPVYSASNPVVGRYAFWTDDESSRLNINTALSGKAAFGESDPDLTTLSTGTGTLPGSEVADLKNVRDPGGRRYQSVEDLKSADPSAAIAAAVAANRESLTHFSHAPGLNRFGEPRIVLTTQANLAGGRPYLDILRDDKQNSDPGDDASLDKAKIEALFAKLYPYFLKTAAQWGISYTGTSPAAQAPATFGARTMVQRYAGNPRYAAQYILNLIDYVRGVESGGTLILPLKAAVVVAGSNAALTYGVAGYGATGNYGPNALRGNSRRLHIVEMGVWLPAATVMEGGKHLYKAKLKVRIYLPRTVGENINVIGLALQPVLKSAAGGNYATSEFTIDASHLAESSVMAPGQYRTITKDVNIEVAAANARPAEIRMRIALKNAPNGIGYDLAPVEQSETIGSYARYVVDAAAVLEAEMTSISVDDPVTNQCWDDWTPRKVSGIQQVARFGTQDPAPESTLGQVPPVAVPQQDTTAAGVLTDVSCVPPPPKGKSGNTAGVVRSVGELGRIHSGGAGTSVRGVPWRTLRLQPRLAPQATVPEWLLLDLFAVPLLRSPVAANAAESADAALLLPNADGSVGGRLNANGRVFPFSSALTRKAPLRAVLLSAKPSLTAADADSLADNILNHTVAAGTLTTSQGLAFGPTNFTAEKLYGMPGEICEISGLAPGEEDEYVVQNLLAYLTTRSNVFSVFSVGQKIQQLPNGRILVLGESRTRTLLERENGRVRVVSTQELGL